MAITAGDVLTRVAAIYNDVDYTRISDDVADNPNWYDFINDAMKQLVLVRPDAYCTTTTLQLAAGTKQTLPTAAVRLLDISRYMGTNGTTVGPPIFYVDRSILDLSLSTWHSETQAHQPENYWFDPDNPLVFYVTPPNTGSGYIELTYSLIHTAVNSTDDALAVKDIFLNPIMAWTLYRAFLIDTDSPYGPQHVQHYYNDFYRSLGLDQEVIYNVGPQHPLKGRGVRK